jgi:hypothetical protein
MKIYNKILFLTITHFVNSFGWGMDDPRQPSSILAVHDRAHGASLQERGIYSPAMETGFLSNYEIEISNKEWSQLSSFFEKAFENGKGSINYLGASFCAQAKQAAKHYYTLYKLLLSSEAKVLNSPDKGKLIPTLGHFVKYFEMAYDRIKDRGRRTAFGTQNSFQDTIFSVVQKTFNVYMRTYERLNKTPLGFVEDLHFSQPALIGSYKIHLFYTRDENGFILFNLIPQDEVDAGLFKTYIPYGNIDTSFFVERHFLFSLTSNNKPVLIEDKGYCINKSEGVYNISFYSGNTGIVPYSLGKTIITRRNAENPVITTIDGISQILRDSSKLDSLNNLSNVPPDAEREPEEHSSGRREELENLNTILEELRNALMDNLVQISSNSTLYSLHHLVANTEKQLLETIQNRDINALLNMLDSLLEGQPSKFLGVPGSPLDMLETEYLFLKELREQHHHDLHPNMQFLLEYIQQEFPAQTLDEIIAHYEEELVCHYEAEEREILENAYKAEQDQRSQMVIQGDHYKKKPSHKKKNSHRRQDYKKAKPQAESAAEKSARLEKQYQEAKKKAEQRLKKIKDIKISGSPKFRKYLKLVNKVTQGLRARGVSVTAQLNRSSHGSLAVQGEKISIVRPHGGYNTVHQSAARDLLGHLVQTYFDLSLTGSPSSVEK